jgi:hypothetical protein
MSASTTTNLQLTQAVLQRHTGAETGPREPHRLLIEGIADRSWVAELGQEGLSRVEKAMKAVAAAWQSSEAATKADRLGRELNVALSAETEALRRAAHLEVELASRLEQGAETAGVEGDLAVAKADLARLAVKADVLRHLHERAHAASRDRLRNSLEAARLKIHQDARQEYGAALHALEKTIAEYFPAVNRSGYVYSLTRSADLSEHHLRLAGIDQPARLNVPAPE